MAEHKGQERTTQAPARERPRRDRVTSPWPQTFMTSRTTSRASSGRFWSATVEMESITIAGMVSSATGAGASPPSLALTASQFGATRSSMLGSNTARCQPPRRQFLMRSQLSATYASLAGLFQLRAVTATREQATADSCILLFRNGGLRQLDTMVPKPDQPAEIRGEFAPIRRSPDSQEGDFNDKHQVARRCTPRVARIPAGSVRRHAGHRR